MARTKKEAELDPRYATKDDIKSLLDAMVKLSKEIKPVAEIPGTADMSKVKESVPEMRKEIDEQMERGLSEKAPVPPAWRKMVDEILGIEFGVDVVYPQSGSGFLFRIIVPPERSNVSEAHKNFYGADVRTKAVSYSDGIEGVRKFCEMVKKNLEKK